MTDKLKLLKDYIALQACDEGLWFVPDSIVEGYLQQELRRIAWLIEKATTEQIKMEIENKRNDVDSIAPPDGSNETDVFAAALSASFLLGMSMSALYSVQQHLIQAQHKEALTTVNDAVKMLNEKITRSYYSKEVKANAEQG